MLDYTPIVFVDVPKFKAMQYGSVPEITKLVVRNEGEADAVITKAEWNVPNFVLTIIGDTIEAGKSIETALFLDSAQPLPIGNHKITLTLTYGNDQTATTEFNFTVTAGTQTTPAAGTEKSWNDVAADIIKSTDGTLEVINLNGNTTVPATVINAIAASDAKVTLKVVAAFSWTIDGSKIDKAAAADLSITKATVSGTDTLRGSVGTGFKLNGTNAPTGLNINFKKTHSEEFANLFMKVDTKLVFVDNVKNDANDAAVGLDVSEKGEYVVMLGKYSTRKGDVGSILHRIMSTCKVV